MQPYHYHVPDPEHGEPGMAQRTLVGPASSWTPHVTLLLHMLNAPSRHTLNVTGRQVFGVALILSPMPWTSVAHIPAMLWY